MLERGIKHALVGGLVTAVVGLMATPAWASGFAAARFGGEHGNPTETNPSTLYYNPAGIGLSTGTNLMLDLNVAFRSAQYDRPTSAIGEQEPFPDDEEKNQRALEANSGAGTLDNTILSPMFGVSTDFGLEMPLKVGAAFFAPFGGAAVWDKDNEHDVDEFPGAIDGSQRWYSIDGEITTLALAGGLAYNIESIDLSLGLTGNAYFSTINTLRARNSDGSDDLVDDAGTLKEGRSWVDVSSTDWGFGAGALWEVMEKKLWLGASYQSRPNVDGDMEFEGELINYLGVAERNEANVILTSALPDIYRLGGRYRPVENLELRLFADLTRWSALEQQCLVNEGTENLGTTCETQPDGSSTNEGDPDADTGNIVQILQRDWKDAFGVRVGASWWLNPEFELLAGGGFDQNAVPDETLDAALMDMNKFTASLGAKYGFTDWVSLMLTATNVFYLERDTTGVEGNEAFELPSRQPGNQGVYDQNIFLINTNLQFTF